MYLKKSNSEAFPMGTISKRIILKTFSQLRGIFVIFGSPGSFILETLTKLLQISK